MCSAIQPSSRAMFEAMRSAKHFLPSRALPPYPEPKDQISRVSGKWTMYFWSLLQGHGTSAWPFRSGAPTECMQGTTRWSSRVDEIEHRLADARHDAHVHDDVGRIREFDADARQR